MKVKPNTMPDDSAGSEGGGGSDSATTFDAVGHGAATQTPPDFLALVPDQYKETEWVKATAKTANPIEEMFKQRESLEQMIGNRPQVPTAESTPEQIANWNKFVGVPEDHTAYSVEPLDWEKLGAQEFDKPVIDFLNSTREGEFFNVMKQVAHKAGLRPDQFQAMEHGLELALMAQHRDKLAATIEAEKSVDAQYETVMKNTWGAKADEVSQIAGKFLQQKLPPEMHAMIPRLSAEQLSTVAGLVYTAVKDHVREDNVVSKNGASATTGESVEGLSSRGRQIMVDPDFNDPSSSRYDALHREYNEIYARQRAILAAQGK